ncbi:sensor histidine kinase [Pseudoalteromonas sp. SSM20]|uniref:sensor histidine kinase n=1 Tax=Pseudoalteromonas sp. SSM20 TaxID=3139394 RepID=UPI003BA935F3
MQFKTLLSGRWLTSLLLLALVNGLLITHNYPASLILLIDLIVVLWYLIETYRDRVAKQNTINLIDTLLISLRQGDYSIRANEVQDSALSTTVSHLNALATTMQNDQRLLAEQQDLLKQIIEKVDFALMVFNQSQCIYENDYAKNTFNDEALNSRWQWYQGLLDKSQNGRVNLTINTTQHTFLIEHSICYMGAEPFTLLVLKQLDSILYQQEKDALQKFVRILSHEINNTLAPIGTVARSLNKRLSNEIDVDSFATGLTLINERANYLKSFMDNYVSLAKLPSANKSVESCGNLCNEIAEIYPLIMISCEENLYGYFDVSQIKQVLCHLINNALEAQLPSPDIELTIYAKHEKLIFCVSDNGPGFSNLADATTAFYTTKQSGNGIGLMLSRIIVENHKGQLELKNQASGGALVTFSLERITEKSV